MADVVFDGAAWRGVKVDSLFDLFRELQAVKEEPGAPYRQKPAGRKFDREQHRFLEELKNQDRDFDPSTSRHAFQRWSHLLQDVDVQHLRHTHDVISARFRHGEHEDQTIEQLTEDLIQRTVLPGRITPLVALKWDMKYWVICGNRRLKALQDFEKTERPNASVFVRCIVHEHHSAPSSLIAKFLLAWSTTNHGVKPVIRNARSRSRRAPRERHAPRESPQSPHRSRSHRADIAPSRSQSQRRALGKRRESFVHAHCDRKVEDEFLLGPDDWRDCDRFGLIPSNDDTFYIRFYEGHKGKYGHEFVQFDIHATGRLRYANVSKYPGFHPVISKECNITHHALNVFKVVLKESKIVSEDCSTWPPQNGAGCQELELLLGERRVTFVTCKIDSTMKNDYGEGFRRLCFLVEDLKAYMLALLYSHFKIEHLWHFDPGSKERKPLRRNRGEGPVQSLNGWVVLVVGVHEEAHKLDIVDFFTDIGDVTGVESARCFESRGGFVERCAFIPFHSKEGAEEAINMNGSTFLERTLHIDWAFCS